jgi:hypothetical protein
MLSLKREGFLFEVGFKLGLAKALSEENHKYQKQWKKVLERIEEEIKRKGKKQEEYLGILNKVANILGEDFRSLTSTLFDSFFKKPLVEYLREKGIEVGISEKVDLGIFEMALYGGFLSGKKIFKGKDIFPERVGIFEEIGDAGNYRNADLILIEEKNGLRELHIYDFKLYGGTYIVKKFLTPKEEEDGKEIIPPKGIGYLLALTLGNNSLKDFAKSLIEVVEYAINNETLDIHPELSAILQFFHSSKTSRTNFSFFSIYSDRM